MLVVLAKLGSPEMVGHFALGQAVAGPIIIFSMLQLRGYQATDTIGEYLFGHYFALTLLTSCLGLFLTALCSLAAGYRAEALLVILTIALFKAVEGCSDVCYGALQQNERMDLIAVRQMLKGPSLLAALSIGLYFSHNLIAGLCGMICVLLLFLFLYDLPNVHAVLRLESAGPVWDFEKLVKLAKTSFPLGLVMMILSVNTYLPRYFIEHSHGVVELGVFAALASVQRFGGLFMQAVTQSAAPRFAKYYQSGDRHHFFSLVLKLAGIGAVLGGVSVLIAALYGEELLSLLFGSEFVRKDVFIILCIAGWVQYIFSLGIPVTAARYIRVQVPIQLAVFSIVLLICFLFVPYYGIVAAAYSLLAGACFRGGTMIAILTHLYLYKIGGNCLRAES